MTMTFDELQQIIRLHNKYLAEEDGGEKACLKGAELFGALMAEANLSGANFDGANIRRALLWHANLEGAIFDGVFCKRANMEDANLKNASFKGAHMKGANLTRADLRGANFSNADMEDVILAGAKYNCETIWPESFDPTLAGAILCAAPATE